MQNPYLQNFTQYPQSYTQGFQQTGMFAPANNTINWVSGEAGAKSWLVGRGETALLMDSEAQCFYIKSADASGMPLPLRVFDYTERNPANLGANSAQNAKDVNYITRAEMDEIWGKIEALEKQMAKPARRKEVTDNE